MKRKHYLLSIFGIAVMFMACGHKGTYSEFHTLPIAGWHADSLLSYTFPVTDTLATYEVLFYVRNTTAYPYQNMWLFVGGETPEGKLPADTVEFYLADQRGQWLGNGVGSIKEMPVMYKQSVRFPRTGNYTYTLQQGMREELLIGINDVGVKVVKK